MSEPGSCIGYFRVADTGRLYEEEFCTDFTIRDVLALAAPDAAQQSGDDCILIFNGEVLADDAPITTALSTPENRLVIKSKPSSNDIPNFRPLPAWAEGETPPWGIPFEQAIAELANDGYDVPLARRALELAGSLDMATKLLESGQVSEAGVRSLNLSPPAIRILEGDDAIRAVKPIFEDPEALQDLKAGFGCQCTVPDGRGGTFTFLLSPEQADSLLRGEVNRSLAEFQAGDPFGRDLKAFPLPAPKSPPPQKVPPYQSPQKVAAPQKAASHQTPQKVAPPQKAPSPEIPKPVLPVPPPSQPPQVPEKIKADPVASAYFDSMPVDQREAIAALVNEFGLTFWEAFDPLSDADGVLEVARRNLAAARRSRA
jgi:hypothetical protein